MEISKQACNGCELCIPYCVAGAIHMHASTASIDLEQCVECGTCIVNAPCPQKAFRRPDLKWPRIVRQWFSSNLSPLPNTPTHGGGRGVVEVKTNDRINYYKPDEIGLFIEMGRPGVSTSMRDVEKMTCAFARHGFRIATYVPMAALVADPNTGELNKEILGERVLSCTLEYRGTLVDVPKMIEILREMENKIDTVFSVGLLSCFVPAYTLPVMGVLDSLGVKTRPNAKVNVGLGRPINRS